MALAVSKVEVAIIMLDEPLLYIFDRLELVVLVDQDVVHFSDEIRAWDSALV